MAKKHKLKILGEGTYAGGDFSKARIIGNANVVGCVNAETVRVVGEVEIDGDVTAEKVRTVGKLEIKGNFSAEKLRITGEVEISGNAKVAKSKIVGKTSIDGTYVSEDTKITGEVKIKENVTCKKIKNLGSISTEGNVTAEEFYSQGSCEIEGLLTAENVILKLQRKTKIKEIGGTNILVKKKYLFAKTDSRLVADIIEGDEISLESTTANVVRGNSVTIGKGCNIKLVEYSDDFKQHESSIVDKAIKI